MVAAAVTIGLRAPRAGTPSPPSPPARSAPCRPPSTGLTDPVLAADQVPTALRECGGSGPRLATRARRRGGGRPRAARGAPRRARERAADGAPGRRGRPRRLRGGGRGRPRHAARRPAAGWATAGAEFRGEGGDAVANDPGRLVSTSGNQRRAWWGEAWRGFEATPGARRGRRRGSRSCTSRSGAWPTTRSTPARRTASCRGMLSALGVVGLLLLARAGGRRRLGRAARRRPAPRPRPRDTARDPRRLRAAGGPSTGRGRSPP